MTDYSVQWANKIFGMTDINNQMLLSQPFDNKTDPYLIQSNYFYNIKSSSYLLALNYAKLNDTEKRKCGYLIDDVLLTCTNKMVTCNKTNDFIYSKTDFRDVNCFTYNSGVNMNGDNAETKESSQIGIESGLSFELLLPQSVSESTDLFSTQYGYQIFISNQGEENKAFYQGKWIKLNI